VKADWLELRLIEMELRRGIKVRNWHHLSMWNFDLGIKLTDTAILMRKERVGGGIETT
jgi:hypothetical protein